MSTARRLIEVDETTALTLEAMAQARDVSVAEVVADLLDVSDESGDVPHERVAEWLSTWGSDDFKPWPGV